jgi:hypothetical protein
VVKIGQLGQLLLADADPFAVDKSATNRKACASSFENDTRAAS